MAGLNFLTLGTAAGGFLTGYDQAKQAAAKQQREQQLLQDAQEERQRRGQQDQAARSLYGAIRGGGLDQGGLDQLSQDPSGGGLPGAQRMPAQGDGQVRPQQLAPQMTGNLPGTQRIPQQPQQMGGGAQPPQQPGQNGAGSRDLTQLANQVAPGTLPPGYQLKVLRGEAPGATVAGTGGVSQHALGRAIDVQIIDPQGRPIPNTGEDTTGLYGKLAKAMWGQAPPQMRNEMAWGGNFTTGPQNGPKDLMHFDLGGDRGRFGRLAQEAGGGNVQQVADRQGGAQGAPGGRQGQGSALLASAPPQMQQAAQQTLRTAGEGLDPSVYGKMSLSALAQRLDKANPGGDPLVKMMALEMAQKLLAPSELRQWEMFKLEHQDQMQAAREAAAAARQDKSLAASDERQIRMLGAMNQRQDKTIDAAGQRQDKALKAKEGAPANPQEVAYWAEVLKNGGHMPPGLARTAAGSKIVQDIMAKMAADGSLPQGMSPNDFIANVSTVKADDRSLSNMTKMADAATSFERTASQNFDLALKLSKDAVPTDLGPFFNRWVENGETQFGDVDVPPYVTAMLTGANEYAKIMSGSTGAQGSTVDSRREAAELFSPYLSAGQIDRVVAVAKADMGNRKQSLYGQIDDIKGRLRGAGGKGPTATQGQPAQAAPQPQGQRPAGGPQEPREKNPQTGEWWIFRDGKWQPENQKPPI